MCPKTELFLYLASRAQHVCRLIAPALTEGRCVVSDRYSLASVAYQGAGRELGVEPVSHLCDYASDGLWPDVTFVLDLDPEVGLQRKKAAGFVADRLEQEHITFHMRVRQAYLAWAKQHPEHVVVLDGDRPRDELEKAIWHEVAVRMSPAMR
jgi:dTMP kinase